MPNARNNNGKEVPKKGRKRHPKQIGAGYDVETTYNYFKLAGGNMSKAMRMAKEAGETRTCTDNNAWANCIRKFGWKERLHKETVEEWKKFHGIREAKKQRMLDLVAHAIEPLIEQYGEMLAKAFAALKKKDNYEIAILRSDFAFGPDTFDKMVRLYCRAMGMPEKITHSSHDVRPVTVMTHDEAEEQKRLSREGKISRPMPQKDLAAAKALMATIDLGPEWTDDDDDGGA